MKNEVANVPTINDVAREARVGVGTVSRYLNGYQLKQSNMDAIKTAIEKLGYKRNVVARSMKTGKSMTIAVVVPNLANMFSMRIIESIERVLEDCEYSVIVADCNGREEMLFQKLSLLKNKMVDGFVLMSVSNDSAMIKTIIEDTALVLIDRTLDENIFDSVTVNNETASYKAVVKMLQNGIRKIGIIEGPQNISTAKERSSGYKKALLEYNISNDFCVDGGYTYQSGFESMKKLLNYDLEAVFTSNYELTLGAINAINNSGKQLKLIGFDSLELSNVINMPIISISQPIEEIGEKAAKLLLDRINNPNREPQNIIIEIN